MRIVAVALGVFIVGQSVSAMAANKVAASGSGGLPPSTVCMGTLVHKPTLVTYFLNNITPNQNIQLLLSRATDETRAKLFTERPEILCPVITQPCADPNADPKICKDAANACGAYVTAAQDQAHAFFQTLNMQPQNPKPKYELSSTLKPPADVQVNKYLDPNNFDDSQNPITCNFPPDQSGSGGGTANANQAPTIPIANFRLRGKSDDLYIDRGTDQFKSTTPAALNWTGTDQDNYNVKLTATLGYQLPTDTGEIIPYISANQSLTDATKKPRVIDPNSNVAFGFVAANSAIDPYNHNINNWFSAKPQYLFNTADRSEIGSLRLIYAPWVDLAYAPVNTFSMVPGLPGPVWASLLFDLRNDSGIYTQRADTAAIAATDKDFDRIGGRFGLSLTNAPSFPSLTLTVAEVYLYGAAGHYRNVNQFQSMLTYNLESNNYVGLTFSYQNGRDEDTAVASHTYTAGLTIKY